MTLKPQATERTDAPIAVTNGFEQTASAFKDGIFKATAGFQTTQAQVKENVEKAMKTAEELLAFNQGTFEALVQSGKIWSTGVQDITQQVVASAQASLDETLATYRALAAVKSLKEAVELHFARPFGDGEGGVRDRPHHRRVGEARRAGHRAAHSALFAGRGEVRPGCLNAAHHSPIAPSARGQRGRFVKGPAVPPGPFASCAPLTIGNDALWSELRAWRRDFPRHPQFGFGSVGRAPLWPSHYAPSASSKSRKVRAAPESSLR